MLFRPDIKDIQKVLKELEENGYDLTLKNGYKDNIFYFLDVIIKPDKESQILVLTQIGLINKILETVVISKCNTIGSPKQIHSTMN